MYTLTGFETITTTVTHLEAFGPQKFANLTRKYKTQGWILLIGSRQPVIDKYSNSEDATE